MDSLTPRSRVKASSTAGILEFDPEDLKKEQKIRTGAQYLGWIFIIAALLCCVAFYKFSTLEAQGGGGARGYAASSYEEAGITNPEHIERHQAIHDSQSADHKAGKAFGVSCHSHASIHRVSGHTSFCLPPPTVHLKN
jgi:hypothetical protein